VATESWRVKDVFRPESIHQTRAAAQRRVETSFRIDSRPPTRVKLLQSPHSIFHQLGHQITTGGFFSFISFISQSERPSLSPIRPLHDNHWHRLLVIKGRWKQFDVTDRSFSPAFEPRCFHTMKQSRILAYIGHMGHIDHIGHLMI